MEVMQKVASRHGLVCLLHEKPFAGLNGSGKHNNWSLTTDTGMNPPLPGETPQENASSWPSCAPWSKAVDEYQDLLRLSVATAATTAARRERGPPAVVSIYLGRAERHPKDFRSAASPIRPRSAAGSAWAWRPCPASCGTRRTATAPRPSPSQGNKF